MTIVSTACLLGMFGKDFDLTGFLILILVLTISLSFHELAHGWAAWRLGDDTAARQGRLTMNPLAHLDPIGSIAFLIGGIGWARPVPVNPARFRREISVKKGLMLTSLAGPAANLLLATASATLLFSLVTLSLLTNSSGQAWQIMAALFQRLYSANITLAAFNLLPVPPLDGFKILGFVLPDQVYFRLMSYERQIGLVFLALVLFGRGTLSIVLSYVVRPLNWLIYRPMENFFPWLWQTVGLT